jgi:leader peptidase (prepilin peptidase)/N-methyltransferase
MIELLYGPAGSIAAAAALGLLVGSFLNVVILRLPPRLMHGWRSEAREILELDPPAAEGVAPPDLVRRRSHCPVCGHELAWWENIPLLSYAMLRGRCRACGTRISPQYPIVEALTGLFSALVVAKFGLTLEAGFALAATWILIAASGIDLRTTLLPDQLTLPLLWIGLLGAATVAPFVGPTEAILGAVAGYLSLWSVYWAFRLLTGKEGMGYGDFKLLAALGAFCGWKGLLPIVLFSALIGAIVGSLWLAARGRDRATPIPFGPYLAGAGWVQLMYGDAIVGGYLRIAGLAD